MNHIPYGRQSISQKDIDSVINVLKSDFLTQGPAVPAFEGKVKSWVGAKHAIAVNSATSALHLACLALGVRSGDLVWTSPITFVASANCALYCGAKVDFVDIDPVTYNMSPEKLEEKLITAKREGKLPKIVIPVHMAGEPCDMAAIAKLGEEYGFSIIEDASHAVGAKYKIDRVGGCKYSDITIFSFHPVKIITTGEGGMALTNDDALAARIGLLRSHGITRDPAMMEHEPHGSWYYEQIELGYNYRLTDMQAALGLSQFERLEQFLTKRHELASYYDRELSSLPLRTPARKPENYSAFHLYIIRLKLNEIKRSRLEVFSGLTAKGIGVNLHYIPVYLQPYYQAMGFKQGYCPEAEAYYAEAITLPLYPEMSRESLMRVKHELQELLA